MILVFRALRLCAPAGVEATAEAIRSILPTSLASEIQDCHYLNAYNSMMVCITPEQRSQDQLRRRRRLGCKCSTRRVVMKIIITFTSSFTVNKCSPMTIRNGGLGSLIWICYTSQHWLEIDKIVPAQPVLTDLFTGSTRPAARASLKSKR